jgi:hypothetical protein
VLVVSDEEVVLQLFRCTVKGCSWRGERGRPCPMHPDQAWDSQHTLLPDHVVAVRNTRHRS